MSSAFILQVSNLLLLLLLLVCLWEHHFPFWGIPHPTPQNQIKAGKFEFPVDAYFFSPHTERSFLHLLICPAYLTLAQRQKEGEMETARVTQNEPWNKPREKLRQSKRAGINHSKRKQQRSSHKTRRGALRPLNGSASTPTKDEAQLAKNTVASDAPSVNTIAKNNSGSQNNGRSKPAGDNKHAEDTASQTTTSYFHQVRYTSPCLFSKQTNSQPSTFAPCCTLLHIHPSLFKVVTQAHLPPPPAALWVPTRNRSAQLKRASLWHERRAIFHAMSSARPTQRRSTTNSEAQISL